MGTMRVTRNTEVEVKRLSREEIDKMVGHEVTNAKEGMKYMESTSWVTL